MNHGERAARRGALSKFVRILVAATAVCALAGAITPRPAQADVTGVGSNFWFRADWSGETPFQAGVNFATTTNPWNPTFLAEMAPYKALRFMDWNCTNNSGQSSWSTRKAKTSQDQTAGYYASNAPAGIAYEWMIDLCNRTGKDMWICIPHLADDNYSFQLATLIRNTLRSDLKVYVEYSNEVWNGGFTQTNWCNDRGVALGLDPDRWTAGSKYYTLGACKAFYQFDRVFGATSTRVVKVLAGQRTNDGGGAYHLTARLNALSDTRCNPNGVRVNAISVAAYFGEGLDGASANVWSQIDSSITTTANSLAQFRTLADQRGLQFIGYEGGQHLTTNAHIANRDARMYDKYIAWLNAIKPRYNGILVHYAHAGSFSAGGAWGSKESTGQAESAAHKYRALKNWAAGNPGGGQQTTVTLNPTDDRDTQSDNAAGTNTQFSCSQWNTIYLRFNLTGVTGTVSSAKLRVYKQDTTSSLSLSAYTVNGDNWSQATAVGSLPAVGSSLATITAANAPGYVEINLTSAVQAQVSGDKVISLALRTALGSWTWFTAKEGTNKPQLVVTYQ